MYMYTCEGTWSPAGGIRFPGTGVIDSVNDMVCVLGTELGCSTRVIHVLNH